MGTLTLFGRIKKETKLKSIKEATTEDLLRVSENVFIRILKDIGKVKYKGYREIYLCPAPGNDWNSDIPRIYSHRRKVYLEIYHQLSNTDKYLTVPLSEFLCSGDWRGISYETDIHGFENPRYCTYTSGYKAEVVRKILEIYVEAKFK